MRPPELPVNTLETSEKGSWASGPSMTIAKVSEFPENSQERTEPAPVLMRTAPAWVAWLSRKAEREIVASAWLAYIADPSGAWLFVNEHSSNAPEPWLPWSPNMWTAPPRNPLLPSNEQAETVTALLRA